MQSNVDSRGVQRADTTRGPPLRVLSLDGGGVRGFSMFILLEELMHNTYVELHGVAPKRSEMPKPCDHFDLIVGTGTGGLIAIMLGRLRLDLKTCREVYLRMTRKVFESDKTFAGIPYRSTLFKASKMEEAIRECVAEHTIYEDEGNDSLATAQDLTSPVVPGTPMSGFSTSTHGPQRSMSQSSKFSGISREPSYSYLRPSTAAGRWGNPNALLYDVRETRTKTAVTAVYRGTRKGAPPAMLRSYDSRKEPPPEFEASIWQAGRATTAIGVAFKPIQIGQSIFVDEGAGRFNPSPEALDEAIVNEWPGREIGVFVSIGTGKRPNGTNESSHKWWESFAEGAMGDYAEARRRLFEKIEGCEQTHIFMMRQHLASRQVNPEHYYRFNVEVGVGEFGMNEWNRLDDISINTKMYLSRKDVQTMNRSASNKLARIQKAKQRWDRAQAGSFNPMRNSWEEPLDEGPPPPSNPLAVEMMGDTAYNTPPHSSPQTTPQMHPHTHAFGVPPPLPQRPSSHYDSAKPPPPAPSSYISDEKMVATPSSPPPSRPSATSDELPQVVDADTAPYQRPPPNRTSFDQDGYAVQDGQNAQTPPPLPPKTPLGHREEPRNSYHPPLPPTSPQAYGQAPARNPLPYPETDGPPPVVNMAKKPQWS